MSREKEAKVKILTAMSVFGTIGLFVRGIPLPSSVIALVRGVVGVAFLLVMLRLRKGSLDRKAIGRNLPRLTASGFCLGFNWILLFEAYRYTTVSTATLCYYMAPIFIILVSPLLLKERLTLRKLCCVGMALVGMVCISGMVRTGLPSLEEGRGILLGLAAAVLYASIVLLNKGIREVPAFDRTVVQLGVSAVLLLPYCLFTVPMETLHTDLTGAILLLVVGVVHTGMAYYLYFGAIAHVPAQTAAIVSYVDPVVAVLVSVLVLREAMGVVDLLGAVLILGAAFISELPGKEN